MRDLELRGAGNLLGAQQSGHIAAVGYELYCRLLADAVARATKDAPPRVEPATLEVDLPAGVPEGYVRDARETFRLFRRIATAPSVEVLDALRGEVTDRFGPLPPSLERLLLAHGVRLAAGALGVERILPAEAGGLVLEARPLPARPFPRLEAAGLRLRPLDERRAYLPPAASLPETLSRLLSAARALRPGLAAS
jgi:transcription-repair coupling factor (superfamily II helicase)